MILLYLLAGVIAIAAGVGLSRAHPIHALLWLVGSLLGVACLFAVVGASLAAGLQAVVYVGAIMVFFVLVVMLLNWGSTVPGHAVGRLSRARLAATSLAALVLAVEIIALAWAEVVGVTAGPVADGTRGPALALFTFDRPGIELASMLLLVGVVIAHELSALHRHRKRGL